MKRRTLFRRLDFTLSAVLAAVLLLAVLLLVSSAQSAGLAKDEGRTTNLSTELRASDGRPTANASDPHPTANGRPPTAAPHPLHPFHPLSANPLRRNQSAGHPSPASFSCAAVTEIPQVECEALVTLYNSTGGANWRDNSGWLTTNTLCGWYGVTCSGGHVTELRLYRNNLSGSIPPELANLANLQVLYLGPNQLSGNIPPQLGNLANLEQLDLLHNQLSGSIPPELGNLTNLRMLRLSKNQLSGGIPPELGNLAILQQLYLGWNQLSGGIPPELGNLANLQWLDLDYNQLSGGIPPELGDLANLQYLHLDHNQLSGSIPPELGNLANLQGLSLWTNQLSGSIPPELGNLANLESLYLGENQLSGNIPPELGNLTNLESLYLGYNQLSGSIPPELGNLAKLQWLDLGVNQLSGSIPLELGNLANLRELFVNDNPLSGALPGTLTNLTLEYFWFHNTGLCEPPEPTFQAWLAGIPNLQRTGVICSTRLTPIILVPGYFASLCFKSDCDSFGTCQWMPRWAEPVYRPLINALKAVGYSLNENLFISYYNWPRPNVTSGQSFLRCDIQRALDRSPGATRVHIITHSNGALVARSYIQADGRSRVDTLVMIAPPSQGVVRSYPAWAGGDLSQEDRKLRMAIKVLVASSRRRVNDPRAIQSFLHEHAPSLRELLPVGDCFLYDSQGQCTTEPGDMHEHNDFLDDLNASLTTLFDDVSRVVLLSGKGQATHWRVKVRPHKSTDGPLWLDGAPLPGGYLKTEPNTPLFPDDGDGTILVSRVGLPGIAPGGKYEFPEPRQTEGHTQLVGEVVPDVLSALGLPLPAEMPEPMSAPMVENAMVVVLASSLSRILITNPLGQRLGYLLDGSFLSEISEAEYLGERGEPQLVVIPGPLTGDYQITVVGPPLEAQGLRAADSYRLTILDFASGAQIDAFDGEIEPEATADHAVQYHPRFLSLSLKPGWNLISFNVLPPDTRVSSVLKSIDGLYTVVRGYDQGGLSYYPDLPPEMNSLKNLDPYHGYWIKMTAPANLTVGGTGVAAATSLSLNEGWNLVSYLPEVAMPVAQALASIDGLYSVVRGYDEGALSYYPDLPPEMNSLKNLEPQRGYWIKMTQPATLIYP